ncbi:MAG TPA: acetylornithine transaminase [Pseudogracilibacillus sp.]|nr:acetylornithine transaminase [Pseudogracilibacillus sp.]
MALFPTYNRYDLSVSQANGTIVEDINGKKYLDFGSGIGVCNLGHRHPDVQKAVEEQLNHYWHMSNLYKQPIQEEVAAFITEDSAGDNVFFCNSGAEANEAAIKLARKVTGKDKIVTFNQSFHGRTFATMAATGQEKVRTGFGPMLESFSYATFNDIDSVKAQLDEHTAAVMLEVVQGEGGVIPASEAFITELAKLCKEKEILLIIDEIQTGIGRTGKRFGYEHYGIEPDIFTLAKGLGNGLPVGAMVAKKEYADAFGPGSHGSTFGGNPLAMAAAKKILEIVFTESFLDEVEEKATYLAEQLDKNITSLAFVKEVRQKGLMVGIECQESTAHLIQKIMHNGLLTLSAGEKVIRLLPPLTVTTDEIDQAVVCLQEILQKQKVTI